MSNVTSKKNPHTGGKKEITRFKIIRVRTITVSDKPEFGDLIKKVFDDTTFLSSLYNKEKEKGTERRKVTIHILRFKKLMSHGACMKSIEAAGYTHLDIVTAMSLCRDRVKKPSMGTGERRAIVVPGVSSSMNSNDFMLVIMKAPMASKWTNKLKSMLVSACDGQFDFAVIFKEEAQ
ncbi:hypothetical protein COB64_04615 [Candidatus Wolfebacteria bacterium]|nr:MAG: hypothetical protein COB64_04615 [Candidatus Wolfebacteria bacterium]